MPELIEDLDNCMINFDRKVVVTNLLDEYGGQLEEIAKTVNDFLTAEEAKGKKYLKTFLLRGLQPHSENEVITLVPENNLKQRKQGLRDTRSVLYSAETDGGSKSPPTEFVPLKHISIKLNSLEVKPEKQTCEITDGHAQVANGVKPDKPAGKKAGPLGAMFKKQEATSAATKKSPEKNSVKKEDTDKSAGSLGAMFKKQEASATSKKEAEKRIPEGEKKPKQETTKRSSETEKTIKKESVALSKKEKKSPDSEKKPKPTPEKNKKTGFSGFLTKKEESKTSVLKPPTPKKMSEFFKKEDPKKSKLDPNVSINLFEESSSSEDEEALDALKREVMTDDDEDKPSTSNKRRRIIDSDDEDTGPDVKIERREEEPEEMETEQDQANESATYLDEDGFVVTVKAKNKKPVTKSVTTPAAVKQQSPPTPAKKEAASKTPAAKKKQGNIMSFFKKK